MKDIIDILRQQLILLGRLLELAKTQKEKLVHTDAEAARKLSADMEPIMIEISSLDKRKEGTMAELHTHNLTEWLEQQPESSDKVMLRTLLVKQEEILQELKGLNSRNMQFLDRHSKFIDYSINVMTQTSAGVTYGTPGDNGGMPVQGRKMFDTGV